MISFELARQNVVSSHQRQTELPQMCKRHINQFTCIYLKLGIILLCMCGEYIKKFSMMVFHRVWRATELGGNVESKRKYSQSSVDRVECYANFVVDRKSLGTAVEQ